MTGWVYMMSNQLDGILYTGVTSDLIRRVYEHKSGEIAGFTKRYKLDRLVYFEQHDDIVSAFQREKNIKHWSRAWKVGLIVKDNPDWVDLYSSII